MYTNLVEHTEPLQLEAFGGVRTHANPVALNSSNIVAGSFASWAGIPEPATWTLSNGWTVLPSSLKSMIVNGINDAGVMVGTRGNAAKAVIWKDGAGADLDGFVDLPPGASLCRAAAINNNGYIAADLIEGESRRAVLLKPVRDGIIPKLEVGGIADTVLRTNRVELSVNTTYQGSQAQRIIFTVGRRDIMEYMADGVHFVESQIVSSRTNVVIGSDISTSFTFTNAWEAGAYFAWAELQDTNGLTLYSLPIKFVAPHPSELHPYRVSWAGDFQIGLDTWAGQDWALEESSDMVSWTRTGLVTNGFVSFPVTNYPARFYRMAVLRDDWEINDILSAGPTVAPAMIGARSLTFSFDSGGQLQINTTDDGTFTGHDQHQNLTHGTFSYAPIGDHAVLEIDFAETPVLIYRLTIEFTFADSGNRFRGTVTTGNSTSAVSGSLYGI